MFVWVLSILIPPRFSDEISLIFVIIYWFQFYYTSAKIKNNKKINICIFSRYFPYIFPPKNAQSSLNILLSYQLVIDDNKNFQRFIHMRMYDWASAFIMNMTKETRENNFRNSTVALFSYLNNNHSISYTFYFDIFFQMEFFNISSSCFIHLSRLQNQFTFFSRHTVISLLLLLTLISHCINLQAILLFLLHHQAYCYCLLETWLYD